MRLIGSVARYSLDIYFIFNIYCLCLRKNISKLFFYEKCQFHTDNFRLIDFTLLKSGCCISSCRFFTFDFFDYSFGI